MLKCDHIKRLITLTSDNIKRLLLYMKLTFVFLLFGGGSEALPGQRSCDEVHQDVSEGFHVVATGLLNAL